MSTSDYINNLSKQVDNINTCEELLAFKNKVESQLNKLMSDATEQIAKLEVLSTAPTNLATAILWIKNQIDLHVMPALQLARDIQSTADALSSLLSKIAQKANILNCPWSQQK